MDEIFYDFETEIIEEPVLDGNRHYITVDDEGRITDGWSDGPHPERDIEGAVCIDEYGGYQFRLYPDGEENPALYEWGCMIPLYKWDGESVARRTKAEIEKDIAALPVAEAAPTQLDRVEAQVTYTAMMTDTLLEV